MQSVTCPDYNVGRLAVDCMLLNQNFYPLTYLFVCQMNRTGVCKKAAIRMYCMNWNPLVMFGRRRVSSRINSRLLTAIIREI